MKFLNSEMLCSTIFKRFGSKQLRLALLLLSVAISQAGVQAGEDEERDPRDFFFSQSFGDLPDELATAAKEGKSGILLFFEAEGCPYCQAMLSKVLNKRHVQEWYQKHFLNLAIDINGDVKIMDFDGITLPSKVFAKHRKVFVTPVISFIDLGGNEVYRHTGMIKSPEEFLLMGEYIFDKKYFLMEFKTFVKKKQASL